MRWPWHLSLKFLDLRCITFSREFVSPFFKFFIYFSDPSQPPSPLLWPCGFVVLHLSILLLPLCLWKVSIWPCQLHFHLHFLHPPVANLIYLCQGCGWRCTVSVLRSLCATPVVLKFFFWVIFHPCFPWCTREIQERLKPWWEEFKNQSWMQDREDMLHHEEDKESFL